MKRKPFLVAQAELIVAYWPRPNLKKHGWMRMLFPTPGNILFTLIIVAGLLWAQSAGALPLRNTQHAERSTPGTIAYQGRLADADGSPLTDTVSMIFRLYDVPSGGAPLWTEQWTGSNSVQVSDGLFNVMLGSLDPLGQDVITGHDQLWLGITIGTDDEMTPRVQLGSVPFAFQALMVPDGSVTTAKIADGAVTSAKLAAENIEIRGDLIVDGDTESRNIQFGGSTILRDDGSRSLHLLPWGGTGTRWDEVCIGCGSPANLSVAFAQSDAEAQKTAFFGEIFSCPAGRCSRAGEALCLQRRSNR